MYRSHRVQPGNPEFFGDQQISNGFNNSRPSTHSQQKSRLQMNLCLVCNESFLTEKALSTDIGVLHFLNLCNVLQVPSYQDFVPETNPLCPKCSTAVDEYLTLQNKIKELLDTIGQMRKLLGRQLVDSYEETSKAMKNYPVKAKIYKIWQPRIYGSKSKGQPVISSSEESQKSSVEHGEGTKSQMETQEQQRSDSQAPSASYTLLDISNSVSSNASASNHGGVSTAGSVSDNNDNSNLSMECPSPGSPPGFDEGISDHEDREVYVKNLNDEGSGTDNVVQGADAANLKTDPSPNSEGTVTAPGETSSEIKPGLPSSSNLIAEHQWIDKRRYRPVVVTQRRSHPCKFCGKLFPAAFSLQMHERTHTGEKPFTCRICDRGFAVKAAMQKHELTHDRSRYEGEPQYQCDICDRRYYLERSLYSHKRDHMGIKRLKRRTIKYPYDAAAKKKARKKYLETHPRPKRPAVKKEGTSRKRPPRKKVKEMKLDEDGNPIPEEPKKIRRKRSPKPPTIRKKRTSFFPRRKPGMPKEAICQYCGKDFQVGHRLRQHLLVHTGEKPLNCPFPDCPKSFALKGNLDKHMRTHDKTRFEGEPTHICEHCGKKFYILGTLYHHRRKHHLGLETSYQRKNHPCKCTICGEMFASLSSLSHHRVKHGERKYNCAVCGKPFFSPSEAVAHAKRHEPTWLYNTYFRHQCSSCPPETLGFPNKIAFREHWATVHKGEELPKEFKKPPKPKKPGFYVCKECPEENRPAFDYSAVLMRHRVKCHYKPGHFVCTLCPEGNRPAYDYSGSLYKHKVKYHRGTSKKWKPRAKNGTRSAKKRKASEDEMSSSGNSSEDEDFDADNSNAKDVDIKNQPVRRSLRKTRGSTSNIAGLLKESENESDGFEEEVRKVTPKRVRFAISTKDKSASTSVRRKTTTVSRKTFKNVSALSDSFINKILGGRQLRIFIERVHVKSETNVHQQVNQPTKPDVPSSVDIRQKRGRPPGKRNVSATKTSSSSESVRDSTVCPTEVTQENPDESAVDPLVPNPVVKEEPNEGIMDSEDGNDDGHRTPTSINVATTQRPHFLTPMVIHNPLSKDKATKPIVISVVGSDRRENPIIQGSEGVCKEENDSYDADENETVLGF